MDYPACDRMPCAILADALRPVRQARALCDTRATTCACIPCVMHSTTAYQPPQSGLSKHETLPYRRFKRLNLTLPTHQTTGSMHMHYFCKTRWPCDMHYPCCDRNAIAMASTNTVTSNGATPNTAFLHRHPWTLE